MTARPSLKACYVQLTLLTVSLLYCVVVHSAEVVQLKSRPDVKQRILYIAADRAVASAILFAGGKGKSALKSSGEIKNPNNFLIRTRQRFADNGISVVVVDAPSDHKGNKGMVGWRTSKAHATDIAAIVEWLRKKQGNPVWLIGTSRGTISAANAVARLGGPEQSGITGIVLTSTVTGNSKKRPDNIYDTALKKIIQPALLVHNEEDLCRVTPPDAMDKLQRKLGKSSKVELITFFGGSPAQSRECGALAAHGFFRIESEVVEAIATWIKSNG